ncbi:hypothetical protein CFC21_099842 [Triticum aestivum]|uniref:Uncharacterized protein n=3 Tax=Triticum TaxID=4564 RepID=A0A9R1BT72_TRITD|nr:putative disease resistance protein At1g50180 [Triticum aestivum]XP_044424662.1 putative disease resistance protein At1g50180 [Triticum aestivum]KAF7098075.1 hypothetical protein CFC21_099842 [Triticum aestivum]VAI80157.1 unnamed protein product [Triticum turgidum subsp. durum]
MEVVTGVMRSLLPKLGELLMDEYNLHKRVKKDIRFLSRELESMHAALLKVGEVPRDQLDKQVKLWADEVRELSYNMEDVVDKFLVRVVSNDIGANSDGFVRLKKKMVSLFRKGKNHHRIADAIKDIKEQIQEVAARRDRNKVDGISLKHTGAATIDPRVQALYTDMTKLVGIYGNRDQELIKMLSLGDDDVSKKKHKIVLSIVGFGGLGKTTLAKAVYNKIKGGFHRRAFVSVGRNANVKKVFRDILIDLGKSNSKILTLDERQLIDEILKCFKNKRYLVVIDDIWDTNLWEK